MNVYTTCEFDHDRIAGCSIGNSVCMYELLFWESKSVLCNFLYDFLCLRFFIFKSCIGLSFIGLEGVVREDGSPVDHCAHSGPLAAPE